MVDFREVIDSLVDVGFYSVILPFILVYAVVFAILEKSGIFKTSDDSNKKQTKNVNSIIAFVFGLFAVAATQTVMWMQSFITIMITFVIFILMVLILLGFIFGEDYMKLLKDDNGLKKGISYTIAGIVLLIAVIVLMILTGAWDWFLDWLDDDLGGVGDTIVTVLIIAGILGVMYWVSKDNSDSNSSK
jgi:small-conductance mechanosensitive channel